MANSIIKKNNILFHGNNALENYKEAKVNICNSILGGIKQSELVVSTVNNKIVETQFTGNMEM